MDRCGGCLDEMVAAVFVATVKIISSVRLSKDSRKVSLKIPTNDVFVLGVYTNVAKRIYEDPYIYQEVVSRNDRRKDLVKRMDGVVEETVKEMLPINQILKTYLNKNPMDRLQEESEEAHTAELGEEELPLPEGDDEGEPPEVIDHGEEVPPPMPMPMPEEETMEEPHVEETKNFTFNDKIMKRTEPTPLDEEQEEDFSINPSANR